MEFISVAVSFSPPSPSVEDIILKISSSGLIPEQLRTASRLSVVEPPETPPLMLFKSDLRPSRTEDESMVVVGVMGVIVVEGGMV